jgi:phosphoribosylformimino-5-aminoimidazole carboxamide ribotide isomerase
MKQHCPGLSLLVDNGTASEAAARSWIGRGLGALVVGSETMPPKALARDLECPLSLDFRAEGFQGPPGLDTEVQFWPETLIVMTLARVGSGEGPDLERLAAIRERAGERRIFAAGGVRNARDLHALADLGIDGVLAATCLHNGSVTAADIAALNP